MNSSSQYHWRYLGFLLFLVAVYVLEGIAILELVQGQAVQDQFLRILMAIVLVAAIVLETHYFIQVAEKAGKFEQVSKQTHSFVPHLCHDDPETAPIIGGRVLPICSRHLGFYLGVLVSAAITAAMTFGFWTHLASRAGLPMYVTVTMISVAAVPLHGTLTRMFERKEQKTLRFLTGFLSGLSWVLLATLILTIA